MTGKDFPTEHLSDLTFGCGPDGYTLISNELVETSRWSVHYDMVFGHGGKFWTVGYSRGATEYQDEGPFEDAGDTVTCTEVVPVQKTITVYEPA